MQNLKDSLEIIYFISGPILTWIAFLALGQIRVAKEQLEAQRESLRVSSKRDALRLTAEQMSEYSSKVIPLINALDKKIADHKITYFTKFEVQVSSDSIVVTPKTENKGIQETFAIAEEIVAALNALEAFSIYFVSGVADERVAYLSLGTTYCTTVKELAPVLVQLGSDDRRFAATLKLFTIWYCRLESEELRKQKEMIEEKLSKNGKVTIQTVGAKS